MRPLECSKTNSQILTLPFYLLFDQDERLRYQKSEFERLSGQLDQLNESLFGQNSPEFPTQDVALSAVKVLETLSGFLQAEMAREKRAREKIIKA